MALTANKGDKSGPNVVSTDYRHDAEYFWPEKEDMQGSTAVWPANVGGIQLALSQKGKHRS